jgi:hypothetical protein
MQQKAQGTEERDADGIALAYAFFAEAEEGKYGKDPAKVQAAIKEIEAKFTAMPAAELPRHLAGHKCASNFRNHFAGNPWVPPDPGRGHRLYLPQCPRRNHPGRESFQRHSKGTAQMVGVSGHATYWSENPELLEKIANSCRAHRWKLGG